jgi:subtilase family serine protease
MSFVFDRSLAALSALGLLCSIGAPAAQAGTPQSSDSVRFTNSYRALPAGAKRVGALSATDQIDFAVSLPLRNQSDLTNLIHRIYDPTDSLYRHYLTPETFREAYSPTQEDYDTLKAYLVSKGLTITKEHSNRLLIGVRGSASAVGDAFNISLSSYTDASGRVFRKNDEAPSMPLGFASKVLGISGLDTSVQRQKRLKKYTPGFMSGLVGPKIQGSGVSGGLTPADIKKVYNLTSTSLTGAGVSMALVQLSSYSSGDIASYISYFRSYFGNGYSAPITVKTVGNAYDIDSSGDDEVCLDIELSLALAPGLSNLYVYESPNTTSDWLDMWNKIAEDDTAQVVSCSWGTSEAYDGDAAMAAEETYLSEMATQGQSVFLAAGDNGAFDSWTGSEYGVPTVGVDDPGSQVYVTDVGGTTLTLTGTGGAYSSETTWYEGYQASERAYEGAGGGISSYEAIPSWQTAAVTVSNGGWQIYAGTSAGAPLWAAFTALVDQLRGAANPIGFLNPTLYPLAEGASYSTYFHDIADGSNNGKYTAVTGYDLATGWGSFNGGNLLSALGSASTSSALLALPSGWSFITLPWDYSSSTLAQVFGSTPNAVDLYNNTSTDYDPQTTLSIGTGYWVNLASATNITLIKPTVSTSTYSIPLVQGWNQIGDPYVTSVTINSLKVLYGSINYSWSRAVGASLVYPTLYSYPNMTETSTRAGGVLQPCYGYWIYSFVPATLIVSKQG